MKINIKNVVLNTEHQIEINQLDKNMNFIKMLHENIKESGMFTFNRYYENGLQYNINELFPYIFSNGIIRWNVRYNEVTLDEFINTHEIDVDNDIIYVETGMPAAGGPGLINPAEAWEIFINQIWPVVSTISTVISIADQADTFVKYIRQKILAMKNKPYPDTFTYATLRKNQWNISEFAEEFQMNEENTKLYLKAMGYEWDRKKMLYVIDDESKKERLNLIGKYKYLDI